MWLFTPASGGSNERTPRGEISSRGTSLSTPTVASSTAETTTWQTNPYDCSTAQPMTTSPSALVGRLSSVCGPRERTSPLLSTRTRFTSLTGERSSNRCAWRRLRIGLDAIEKNPRMEESSTCKLDNPSVLGTPAWSLEPRSLTMRRHILPLSERCASSWQPLWEQSKRHRKRYAEPTASQGSERQSYGDVTPNLQGGHPVKPCKPN